MTESIQKVLTRVRAPRVKITYDVEIGSAIEKKELPFVIGVISDLFGDTQDQGYKTRKFINLDQDNFSQVMQFIKPSLMIAGSEFIFTSIEDFSPDAIAQKVPFLSEKLEIRKNLLNLLAKLDGNDALDSALTSARSSFDDSNLDSLKTLLADVKMIKSDQDIQKYGSLIKTFLEQDNSLDEKDNYVFITNAIGDLDQKLSEELDQILHEPRFQELEGRWRGLKFLIDSSELDSSLKVKLFVAQKDEIATDLNKATQFDQSILFKKIYEEEFGTFGGSPFSCIVGDFLAFSKDAPDISLLEKITTICAASHAPFLSSPSPELFGLENFSQLPNPRDLAKIFESTEYAAWNSFRETEDARYCALMLPRILIRMPYGPKTNPVQSFVYNEQVNGLDNNKFCWANAAYAMAAKIAHAFSLYHWTASIRGVEGGGLVENLPSYTFKTSEGDLLLKCPTEISITDRREKELSDLGFIALCHAKNTDKAAFFSSQTVQKPKVYNLADASANSNLSARLSYMLNTSRFAHYIKMIMRDKIGSLMSKSDLQNYVQNWIAQYVLLSDSAGQELKSKYPLREASVQVLNDPSNPGSYRTILYLRPHFQMEELSVSLRLVANIPAK